jgi:hypothetical protein
LYLSDVRTGLTTGLLVSFFKITLVVPENDAKPLDSISMPGSSSQPGAPTGLSESVLVGVIWGATNSLLRRGSIAVDKSLRKRSAGFIETWIVHLVHLVFIVPQVTSGEATKATTCWI